MGAGWRVGLAVAVGLTGSVAHGGEWETVATSPYVVKTREVGSVKEYLVEGILRASVVDLQETLCESERFPAFMPHVREARVLAKSGNTEHVYVRVDPPVGGSRDYVSEVTLVDDARAGGGSFRQRWRAAPKYIPERRGITRLQINEGSWEIAAHNNGGSRFVYRFRVDPGGWVPAFVKDMATESAIPDTLRAIEQEALRRERVRVSRSGGGEPRATGTGGAGR